VRKLIVGLGNPGHKYTWTRHNLGFLVLGAFGSLHKVSWRNSESHQGMLSNAVVHDIECSLLMPTTFMNNSGVAVAQLARSKGIDPENILVVCDDLSLPFGKLRVRPLGSAGGHNGLKSIIEHLGGNRFARLRLGIGAPAAQETSDYVLTNFTSEQKKVLPEFINHALDCVTCWVTEGAAEAMNKYNKQQEVKEK